MNRQEEKSESAQGKPSAWETAFYRLAQHLKHLSHGRINHKRIYSLVAIDGQYVCHDNPAIRKCTAGSLSHIIHSKQYAERMRRRYESDANAFASAAQALCADLRAAGIGDAELLSYLMERCWPDVLGGLCAEYGEFRADLNLLRIQVEMGFLFAQLRRCSGVGEEQAASSCVKALESMLHAIAFGCLDSELARMLVDETPLFDAVPEDARISAGTGRAAASSGGAVACIVRFADAEYKTVLDWWPVSARHPFTIGRYTDCDAIETDQRVSRIHCCIYCKDGRWYFEDMSSAFGSVVLRDGEVVLDTAHDAHDATVEIPFGSSFVLAGISHYRFLALRRDDARSAMAKGSL